MLRRVREVNYEVHMPDKRKRRAVFHINMLKKWHPPEATCFWMAGEDDGEDAILSWRGECGKFSTTGTQLSEKEKGHMLELLEEFKSVISGKCERTSIYEHHIRTSIVVWTINIWINLYNCIGMIKTWIRE